MIRFDRAFLPAALAASVLAAGCSDSDSSSGGTTAAPTTSNNNGASNPSPSHPDPGGGIAALGGAPTVNASLTTDAFTTFKEQQSVSDVVVPDVPGLRDRAFVVEERGTIRVLDLSGGSPTLDRAIDLPTSPFPAGVATGALRIQDAHTAVLVSSGSGGEAVYLFDPSTASGPGDVTRYDLGNLTVTWQQNTLDSRGVDVGGQALPLTYTVDAVIAGGALLIANSNLDGNFDYRPGTVYAFDLDPSSHMLSNPRVLGTTAFNPTALTRFATPAGDLVLVTNAGPPSQGPSSVDVIDPVSFRMVASIGTGPRNATGRIAVTPDQKRGYLASQSEAEVYVLDLDGLASFAGTTGFTDASGRYLGGFALPSGASTNFVSDVALSHTGRYVYAASFNESEVYVLDTWAPGLGATVAGFSRSGDPANLEGLANLLAVRPGVPGVAFQGPSLYVTTINLAPADRTLQDVTVALDAVTLDAH